MPKVGDLVIFGETDAPEAHCIGRVVKKAGNMWYGEYLSKRTKARYSGGLCDTMVTPVSDFGVRATVEDNALTVEEVGPSVAFYSDHKPRGWQERLPVTIETS